MLEKVGNLADRWSDYTGPYPLSYKRDVVWGDCDPAGIIYTPRILDYAMETLEKWNREVLGVTWTKLTQEMSMGAPTVRVEIDFVDAPKPDDKMVSDLRVIAVGNSSVTYGVIGHNGQGREYYRCKVISCYIARPAFTATPVPDVIRRRIDAYRRGCGDI